MDKIKFLKVEDVQPKELVGHKLSSSLVADNTSALWRGFLPRCVDIRHRKTEELISLQIYPQQYFEAFDPRTNFEKWALAEVDNMNDQAADMQKFLLAGGEFAVFLFEGSRADVPEIYHYIFNVWLPASAYALDQRPHFEVLGKDYDARAQTSREHIYIPVKPK